MFAYITSQNEAHVAADEPDNLPFRQSINPLPHAWLRDCSRAMKETDRAFPQASRRVALPFRRAISGGGEKAENLGERKSGVSYRSVSLDPRGKGKLE